MIINVLLCHHHLEDDGVEDGDYSKMRGSEALIKFLSDSNYGRWMVIHGHRHRARLYTSGGATGPIILSSASFSATRDGDYENASPNQAHLIEFDFQNMDTQALYPAGTIKSWTYVIGMGWVQTLQDGGLPPITGFGFRGSIDVVARKISESVGSTPVKWSEIVHKLPELQFFEHSNIKELEKTLRSDFQTNMIIQDTGIPYMLQRS